MIARVLNNPVGSHSTFCLKLLFLGVIKLLSNSNSKSLKDLKMVKTKMKDFS